ncbi:hypothetical protein B0H11DRAFT_1990309 [Mycena galericulata]|nr:hypothetical protein B0H11DRAFT_1990309 [Mycena galericulata]
MSFFDNGSGFIFLGGSFYSAGGDVIIQDSPQLVIGASDITGNLARDERSAGNQPSERSREGAPFSGPVRSRHTHGETERFLPYDIGSRTRMPSFQSSSQQSSYLSAGPVMTEAVDSRFGSSNRPKYPRGSRPTASDASRAPDAFLTSSAFQLPNAPPPQFGAHAALQNVYPTQHNSPMTIQNGTFVGGNVNNNVSNGESGTCTGTPVYSFSGVNILQRFSALEAFHDPADSHTQPRCHPETRVEMQDKLCRWCIDSKWLSKGQQAESYDIEPTLLWVYGPAGAGKSAIMTTLSHRLEKSGRLGGAFFFKRGHPTRGSAKVLFVTIALQLAVNSPQLKVRISRAVEQNPTLVGRSLGVQLQELIVKPCSGLQSPPWTVIIDGLDECEDHTVQQEILRVIADSTQQPTPLRFIIASRPGAHIREVLDAPSLLGLYRKFNVESSFADIRTYLVAEFARIHREHSTMAAVPSPWPANELLDRLIHKSSGYFVYASTVIKFVDHKDFRPTRRLEEITNNMSSPGLQTPFGALDELYKQILSAVPQQHHIVPILRAIDIFQHVLRPSDIDTLLGLEPGDAQLSLRGLHSVLVFDRAGDHGSTLGFIHASFSDFLRDPFRAGGFYIRHSNSLTEFAGLVLAELGYMYEDPTKNRNIPLGLFTYYQLGFFLKNFLPQIAPVDNLIHLLGRINFDFFRLGDGAEAVSGWLQRIRPPPQDVLRVWQDYVYTNPFATRNFPPRFSPPFWEPKASQIMQQVAKCPLLLHIAGAIVWSTNIGHPTVRHLLNASWNEVLASLCRLRPILGSPLSADSLGISTLIINEWMMTHQGTWRANICSRLAWGCIQFRKSIDTGSLPATLWSYAIPWGRFIRASPISQELLRSVQEFVPPPMGDRTLYSWNQDHDCHNVIMWLKGFPEPPLGEIHRWENLFRNEQNAASKCPGNRLPQDYEGRWREWDQKYSP